MPPTIRMLVDNPSLRLRMTRGADGLNRPIRWAHVSDLQDPTPFLEGGELLLTTGLALPRQRSPAHGAYVERLARADVVGVGFGVGLSHARVPGGIVDAAETLGIPVLEVPLDTPFIAVAKAVCAALVAEEHELLAQAHRAQLELTRAANGPDAAARLLAVLSRRLQSWVLLVDGDGDLVHAAPAAAVDHLAAVRAESRRLRESGSQGVVLGTIGAAEVVMQAFRGGRHGRSLLAIGRSQPLTSAERLIVNAAASLLAVVENQVAALAAADGRLRSAVLRLLESGHVDAAEYLGEQLNTVLPREPVTVAVAVGNGPQLAALAGAVESTAGCAAEPVLLDTDPQGRLVILLVAGGVLHRQLPVLLSRFDGVAAGTADPMSLSDMAMAVREAGDAALAGRRGGAALTEFSQIGRGSLLALVEHGAGQAFAESLLLPLLRHDRSGRGELIQSLRVWLDHHGHWDSAAIELGVHRHTLRHRVRKAAELLDRDLESTGARMELWAALEILADPVAVDPRRGDGR